MNKTLFYTAITLALALLIITLLSHYGIIQGVDSISDDEPSHNLIIKGFQGAKKTEEITKQIKKFMNKD